MKAVVCRRYGPPEVLQLEELEKPEPKDDEILVKVRATSVTAADYRIRAFDMPRGFRFIGRLAMGFRGPRKKVLGVEVAGVVEEVGPDVKRFAKGDEVFGLTGFGAYAQYIARAEGGPIAKMPANLPPEEAVAVPFGGTTALYFLRNLARLQPGQKILIYGASGGVGTASVQLAKHYGAEVTAVCSTSNLDLVRDLGADHVVDYTEEDWMQNGVVYDVVFDTVGKLSMRKARRRLKKKGYYLPADVNLWRLLGGLWTTMMTSTKVRFGAAPEKAEDLEFLRQLVEDGEMKAVIDRTYSFEEIQEAHRYADTGRKKGNVVIIL